MILATQIVNILLAVGMVLGLLVILGVLTALRAPRRARPNAKTWDDPATAELDDRLRQLTMASPFASEAATTAGGRGGAALEARVERPTPGLIRPSLGADPEPAATAGTRNAAGRLADLASRSVQVSSPPSQPIEPPLPPVGQTGRMALPGSTLGTDTDSPISGRPALPGNALGRVASAQPIALPRAEAIDPLTARFSGSQRLTEMPPIAPPPMDLSTGSKRLGLPGATISGPTRTPEPSTGFSSPPPSTGAGRRNELPGSVASSSQAGHLPPPALDIRAILRGEAGPLGALPPSTSFGSDPAASTLKPKLATGPLPPLGPAAPLGAAAFNSGLLELRMLKPDPEAASSRLSIPSAYPASGRLISDPGQFSRPLAAEPAVDLDATRLMDDFDLPDAGFETHVFSTAELVDDDAILPSGYNQVIPPRVDAANSTFSIPITEYPAEPQAAPEPKPSDQAHLGTSALREYSSFDEEDLGTIPLSDLTYLSLAQEDLARQMVHEVAEQPDVLFVKLMAADGSVLLESGAEAGEGRTNRQLAEVIAVATLEAHQRDLGELAGITVESGLGVLVLSPIHNGAVLAVLLGNPARLGMLRRQVKKPVGSLRTLLMESSVQ